MSDSLPDGRYAEIAGWFDFEQVYDNAVAEASDGAVFVEVGSFLGKSARYMAERIRKSGKRITLFCVDHFRPVAEIKEVKDFLDSCGGNYFFHFLNNTAPFRDIVIPLCLASVEAAKYFGDGVVDFVFIDASHDEASVREDIAVWNPKIKAGGMLAGHDMDLASVRAAVDEVFPERKLVNRSWLSRPFDDLLIFAQQYAQEAPRVPIMPYDAVRKVGKFTGLTLFRGGAYQVQLWSGEPNSSVDDHRHPGVDTIQIYLSGQIYLKVNGVPITPPDRVGMLPNGICNFSGKFTRIRPEDTHSFTLGPLGGSWMTVEKWLNGNPTSTELDWEGEPIDEKHREELAA